MPCGAIVSNPLPRICNEFPHSDYVFSGKVLSDEFRQDVRIRGEPSEEYRIRVDHVFKGRVPHTVSIYTPADSARGVLTVEHRAIVFAARIEGHIVFSGSSNSTSGSDLSRVTSEIQDFMVHAPRVATVAGRVDGPNHGPDYPLGGVRLMLSSGKARKFVRTDSRGNFIELVTPGRWSVRIAEPGWASRTGIYTVDLAEGTNLAKGGCADLELETSPPGVKLEGPDWKRWPK